MLPTLNLICDDYSQVYIDGILVGGNSKWSQVFTTTVSSSINVIAVDCFNSAAQGGLLASISLLNVVTDATWRCTRIAMLGWNTLNFDDTMWPDVNVIQQNTYIYSNVFPLYSTISENASWITIGNTLTSGHMYCRKHLSKGKL